MLPRFAAACALVLAGCGRFGFDARADATIADGAVAPLGPHSAALATFTVQGATFVPAPVELRIPPSPGERWLIVVSAKLESSVFIGPSVEARYLVDGVERGIGGTENSAPGRAGPWQHFVVIDGSDAEQLVTFELRDASGGTATMSSVDITAIQVPASALYATFESELAVVTPTPFTPAVDFSLGTLTGDHVLLMLVNASDRPGLSDAFLEWGGPNGERWLSDYQTSREPWQSVLAIERIQLTGAGGVQLRAWHNSGESTLRYPRLLALPLADFPGSAFSSNTTYMAVAGPAIVNQLVPVAPQRSLYLATTWVEEDCLNTIDAERVIGFPTSGIEYRHVTDNCANDGTYGMNRLVETPAASYTITMATGNGTSMFHHQSTQLLLALP